MAKPSKLAPKGAKSLLAKLGPSMPLPPGGGAGLPAGGPPPGAPAMKRGGKVVGKKKGKGC